MKIAQRFAGQVRRKTTTQIGGGRSRNTSCLLVGIQSHLWSRQRYSTSSLCLDERLYWSGREGSYCSCSQQQFGITRREFSTNDNNKSNNQNTSTKSRPDPFARRPTAKCDPYGQGGKPLPIWEANALLATLDPQWTVVESNKNDDDNQQEHSKGGEEANQTKETPSSLPPQVLTREFIHPDFIAGSKFVNKIAAVAQLNTHFPSIQLERRIVPNQKAWQVVTTIRCHTFVLGGLSTHDFHLAMLIDVEAARPEVKELIVDPTS